MAEPISRRASEIAAAARRLLEAEGAGALTMRRVAADLGIRAPSLYKHLPDKAALEALVIAAGFEELAEAVEAAVAAHPADPSGALAALGVAYRRFALEHPHLYRLMNDRPLDRARLPAGLEDRTAAPILRATGSRAVARAAWAFAHGMVVLELNGRFPPDADLDAAWAAGLAAFAPR